LLGEYVVKEFSKNQVALSSNIVSFAAFQCFYADYTNLDVISFINTKIQKQQIEYSVLKERCAEVVEVILRWANEGNILLSEELENPDIDRIMEHGLKNLGVYHDKKVLKRENDFVKTEDMSLLFFYHNRLTNYPFHEILSWVHKIQVE
jgi:glycerol-3-phosphate O-acyltransferase